jgi:putative transposase
MRRSKFSEDEIKAILMEVEVGDPPREVARRHAISVPTLYRWKARFGQSQSGESRRLRQLEEENRRLRKIVAEQALDLEAVKSLLRKKTRPSSAPLRPER